MKFLHIMIVEKFLSSFIDFTDKHFGRNGHKYIFVTSEKYQYGLTKKHNVEFLYTDDDIFNKIKLYMDNAEKIILHGLWREKINKILVENPSFFKKCYWIMWGGDYYFPEKQTELQKKVIKNIAYLVVGNQGEVDYVKKHYQAQGKHIKAFVYLSNLYDDSIQLNHNTKECINILIGNSSTQTNRHLEVFEKLYKFKNKNIKIFVPLSYGDCKYGMQIMKKGYEMFETKFNPLIDFMEKDEYINFLSDIDIAIFNHNRQQGMGNTITLLGMGKKVYMNKQLSISKMFKEYKIKIFDVDSISIEKISLQDSLNNHRQIKEVFSEKNFIFQLKKIFR